MTPGPLARALRLVQSCRNYGNPAQLLWQRWRRRALVEFRVVDRRTGVACFCHPEAHRMFGEIWFDRDYDVPGLPLRDGDLVIDIGANQGFFTCYADVHGCRVIALEPDPVNTETLRRNVAANGFADRVRVVTAAVKGVTGEAQLFRTERLGGGLNTTSAEFAQKMGFDDGESIAVPAVTLRSLLDAKPGVRIRLCKLDCEGAELEILESLDAEVACRIDAFALEMHAEAYDPARLIDAIARWGTHHPFPAAEKPYCRREILYALSREALRESITPGRAGAGA